MKYVNFAFKEMTPEQINQNSITVQHEKVDTDERKSTKVQEEFTTSEELTEEYSTFSDMSKQDSVSDINVDDTQHQENPHTLETLQTNTTMHDIDNSIHDEYDTSEYENIIEIETFDHYREKIHKT